MYKSPEYTTGIGVSQESPGQVESNLHSEWPTTIDLLVTAKCQLACLHCWGEDHALPNALDAVQWKQVIDFVRVRGTVGVVFSGGEPMIRPDFPDIARYAHDCGLRVTLSTNAILYDKRASAVMPYINDLGISIDGSNREVHDVMRPQVAQGKDLHSFDKAKEALQKARKDFPHLDVTVRTAVGPRNINDLLNLANVLNQLPKDVFSRWKIYEEAALGFYGSKNVKNEASFGEYLTTVVDRIRVLFPQLSIRFQQQNEQAGRYVFIGTTGDIIGVNSDSTAEIHVGNVLQMNEAEIEQAVLSLTKPEANTQHGV